MREAVAMEDFVGHERLKAIVAAARAWRDPEYGPRRMATEKTVGADNRFTKEAVIFAINQQLSQINLAALRRWVDLTQRVGMAPVVAVLEAGNVPFAGLQDYLAVVGSGCWFRGSVSGKSPFLLKAFAREVASKGGPTASFARYADLLVGVDAIIGAGSDETVAQLAEDCDKAGIKQDARLLRGNRFSVAVLDGGEHQEQRLRLAEDALLHEGLGCRNIAVVFAPAGLEADPYFEALSVFRGTFPAHSKTAGALRIPQAFLKAVDIPHAYGEGFDYLVSRGPAEVQQPGHIRWTPYENIETVKQWLAAHEDQVQIVSARSTVRSQLDPRHDLLAFGQAQRPTLDWKADGEDVIAFLAGL